MHENEYEVIITLYQIKLEAAEEANKQLKAEIAELKAELARPERMTPAEYNAYWGIFS